MRVFAETDLVVDPPALERIRAVADEVAGLHPIVAEFFDQAHGEGVQGRKRTELDEIRRRIVQFHHQRARIGGANSHLTEIGDLPLAKGLRVFDRVELVVVLRAGRGREGAFPARDEILGRERRAIAPLRIRPQVERVGFSIRRNLPALGHARHRLSILVVGAEALEQRIHDAALRLACDDGRIQRFRLRAVHKNQIPSRGILAARGQREGENCHANQSCSA